jgi:copper chaperone CopZ
VKTEKLGVNDMQCMGCAGRVRTVLMNIGGVVKVITSLDDHTAEVTFDEKKVSKDEMTNALRTAGFLSGDKCC